MNNLNICISSIPTNYVLKSKKMHNIKVFFILEVMKNPRIFNYNHIIATTCNKLKCNTRNKT